MIPMNTTKFWTNFNTDLYERIKQIKSEPVVQISQLRPQSISRADKTTCIAKIFRKNKAQVLWSFQSKRR
jgi:hypothetical protein